MGDGNGHDVVGIGNAIVDVLCHVDDAFLTRHGIDKGIMQLIGTGRAEQLYRLMNGPSEVCGGSVANTIAMIAMLGGRAVFIGKVKSDHLGHAFGTDLRALGAGFSTVMAPQTASFGTGRSMIFVTPDGERSMNTYLGAAEYVTCDDIDETVIANARWLHLEGYRLDAPNGLEVFAHAIEIARHHRVKVSLTPSDPVCVERRRAEFSSLLAEPGLDLLICNRAELLALFQLPDHAFATALDRAVIAARRVVCTDGDRDAWICDEAESHAIRPPPVDVVDKTGAGDAFAAGFIFALTQHHTLPQAAELGHAVAAAVITRIGGRPGHDLPNALRQRGLP